MFHKFLGMQSPHEFSKGGKGARPPYKPTDFGAKLREIILPHQIVFRIGTRRCLFRQCRNSLQRNSFASNSENVFFKGEKVCFIAA